MKRTKKLLALLSALVLALAMSVTTLAATVTVTDNGPDSHTYTAYQIFTGTQTTDSGNKLADVAWGNGINADNFLTALKADTTVGTDFAKITETDASKTAALVQEVLGTYTDNSDKANAVAKIAYANKAGDGTAISKDTTELANGYYLIVDTTGVSGKDDALNTALLQVTTDVTIGNKTDKPSVEKKVKENTKASTETTYGEGYNDVADYNIGDAVPFKLIATVPDTSNYNTYKVFTFTDTLDAGLTVPAATDVSVYYATDKAAATGTDLASYFDVTVKGQVISITLKDDKDLKAMETANTVTKDGYIIVSYSATLNSNAVIGLNGNENKVDLTYSNNPNQTGDGTPETGKTPEDKVIVFTYELDTTKVDGADKTKTLQGAKFVLSKGTGENKVYAILDNSNKVTKWTKYIDQDAADKDTDVTEGKEIATVLESGSDGVFKVIGLDDGTYYLTETVAPAGYNKLSSDITLTINATTVNNQSWVGKASDALTALSLDVTGAGAEDTTAEGNLSSGIVADTITNNQGSVLPSTGGIGTKLFYVIGGILVLGAGILLVARKRMDA